MPDNRPLVVIVTGLPLEYESMRSHLTNLRKHWIAPAVRTELGDLPGSPWQVALAEVGPPASSAAVIVASVVHRLSPDALLFVGVAGALKDGVEVGDLVVATRIYAFQGGKETPEGFYARPQSWHSSHWIHQAARHALLGQPRVHFSPIAAGDVILNHERSSLLDQLRRSYNDAVAIEMEGAGIAHAAHLAGHMETLTIRGISDVADATKKPEDQRGAQRTAASRAATAAADVLRALEPRHSRPVQGSYAGDHIDFRGSTFFGAVAGKIDVESQGRDE
ncbi:5'-methylthioadenosine/S-adenosylhomocysteine nucleosidase [Streptomyces shaanxiensis]|uniref:5'-methylthioadenosine/S-adenosylhomocysteine nucleosidase n=1 Tax=Streptomyces shaanxiensis TaxID=653357 RepID=A0ABP7VUN8_9ACTN